MYIVCVLARSTLPRIEKQLAHKHTHMQTKWSIRSTAIASQSQPYTMLHVYCCVCMMNEITDGLKLRFGAGNNARDGYRENGFNFA